MANGASEWSGSDSDAHLRTAVGFGSVTDDGPGDAQRERTYRASVTFLDAVYGLMKIDAATHRIPVSALSIALSRLYLDEDLRARVLRDALRSPGPDDPSQP